MLHHLEIYVSNLAQSWDFYDFLLPHLGYELYQDWERGFSYKKGNCYIVFVQTADSFLEAGYHRCRVGLNHLAFYGGSQADVDRLRDELCSRSVKLLYEDRYPYAGGENHYACYFQDPDGIKIEVVGE